MRDTLNELIDFERVRACKDAKLFISATNVCFGKIRVSTCSKLTVDHVLASAGLPMIFMASAKWEFFE